MLYTPETPPTEGETVVNRGGDTLRFDIDRFHCIAPSYRKATSSVPLNRAGEAFRLVPQEMHRSGDTLRFEASGRTRTAHRRMVGRHDPSGRSVRADDLHRSACRLLFAFDAGNGHASRKAAGLGLRPGILSGAPPSSPIFIWPTCTVRDCRICR